MGSSGVTTTRRVVPVGTNAAGGTNPSPAASPNLGPGRVLSGSGALRRDVKSMELSKLNVEESFQTQAANEPTLLNSGEMREMDSPTTPIVPIAIPAIPAPETITKPNLVPLPNAVLPLPMAALPPALTLPPLAGVVLGNGSQTAKPQRKFQSVYTPGTAPEGGPPQEAPPSTGSPHYATLPRGRTPTSV